MVVETYQNPSDDTRDKLLAAALHQFAERGFYGASIAQIAGEVGLTKQALLYHFKRKDDLYSEVLKGIAVRLLSAMRSGVNLAKPPEEQFEAMFSGIYTAALKSPLDARVLMRELLDDQRRDAPPNEWFLKVFLEELVGVLDGVKALAELPRAAKFARVYQLLSLIKFFASSESVLTRFYGEQGYAQIVAVFPEELRMLVRRAIAP